MRYFWRMFLFSSVLTLGACSSEEIQKVEEVVMEESDELTHDEKMLEWELGQYSNHVRWIISQYNHQLLLSDNCSGICMEKSLAENYEKELNSYGILIEDVVNDDWKKYIDVNLDGFKVYTGELTEVAFIGVDDNPVSNLEVKITKKENRNRYLTINGTINNLTSNTYTYVKVKVKLLDENNNVLDSDWIYAVDSVGIEPKESKKWDIIFDSDARVKDVSVEVVDYNIEY